MKNQEIRAAVQNRFLRQRMTVQWPAVIGRVGLLLNLDGWEADVRLSGKVVMFLARLGVYISNVGPV